MELRVEERGERARMRPGPGTRSGSFGIASCARRFAKEGNGGSL